MVSHLYFTPVLRRIGWHTIGCKGLRLAAGRWIQGVLIPLCLAGGIACLSSSVRAQEDKTATNSASKATTQELADEIADIDWLRNLNPLKLTAEQLGKMIAAVSSAQEDYTKKVNALAAERVDKMADEIHAVRSKALAGDAIPADFDERMKKASADFLAKRDQLNTANLLKISGALHDILTSDQIATAVKLTKEAPENGEKSSKTTDAQWFNLYVLDVIINYPRIVPLMKQMRAARAETKGAGSSADTKGTGGSGGGMK